MKWLHHSALAAWLAFASVSFLAASSVQAQEASVVKKATALRESAGEAAPSVGNLAANDKVSRTGERKGAWVQVRTAEGTTGWVHMFDLGGAAAAGAAPSSGGNTATSGLRSLGGLFGGGTSTTTATSTVGIRGLGAEDIANAQPNPAAVQEAERLKVSADQARQFAGQATLQTRSIPPLAEPPRPASSSSPGGSSSGNPSDPNFSAN